jgi:hypothetical protein
VATRRRLRETSLICTSGLHIIGFVSETAEVPSVCPGYVKGKPCGCALEKYDRRKHDKK